MNILYLCDEYPPGRHGGIGTAVQLLAREMVRQGHNVIVAGFYDWGYGGEDEEDDMGVKVFRFRRSLDAPFFSKKDSLLVRGTYRLFTMSGIFQWDITRSLKKYHLFVEQLISTYNIEIIEAPDFNEYVHYCTRYTPFPKFSKPTIIKLHGFTTYMLEEVGKKVPSLLRAMENNVLQQADFVVGVSEYTARKISIYFDYHRDIPVLYNGIDTTTVKHTVQCKDKSRVVFSGSLVEKKGIYQLMKAWNLVHNKEPDVQLYVYGKGPVERVQNYLTEAAKSSVYFLGHVPRQALFDSLTGAQVAIFPSYIETFGLAVIEAMNCATAVIYTQRPPGPEIIEDGVNGILIDPDNVANIADQICYLLNNQDVCVRLASNAKETVLERFDIRLIAQQHTVFYEKCIR